MAARAVRCFEAQTYEPKELVRYENTGDRSIGTLRNEANALATGEIICHFDSDDTSHANRLSEQVAHLQASKANVVGYDEILFWRTVRVSPDGPRVVNILPSEAWIYRNKLAKAGSTFAYWRRVWESRPFEDLPNQQAGSCGEDWTFAQGLNMARVSSLAAPDGLSDDMRRRGYGDDFAAPWQQPRMICSIHGGNSSRYDSVIEGPNWKRARQWDDYCRERMAL
jgi:glycosyltransferase involved in cell wall biosynthesis